jgi:hypothetical protein
MCKIDYLCFAIKSRLTSDEHSSNFGRDDKVGHLGIPGWWAAEMPAGNSSSISWGRVARKSCDDFDNIELGEAAMRLNRTTASPFALCSA